MRNRPIQNVDFELVYCACVEKFVTSNLKTAVINVKGIGNGLILHAMLVTFVTGSRIQIPVYH